MTNPSTASGAIAAEWAASLAAALSAMTMADPAAIAAPIDDSLADPASGDWVSTVFTLTPGAMLIAVTESGGWRRLGRLALDGAGLPDAPDDEADATSVELLNQASSSIAQSLTRRLGREVLSEGVRAISPGGVEPGWPFALAGVTFRVMLSGSFRSAIDTPVAPAAPITLPGSRTIDLLLEVEMPVSVSFGRAQLPLRDVMKLSSGSIVELNRTISEPVEVIVNNCVIARGEVVVVDGNYGVRIQQVISKEERLRTLS